LSVRAPGASGSEAFTRDNARAGRKRTRGQPSVAAAYCQAACQTLIEASWKSITRPRYSSATASYASRCAAAGAHPRVPVVSELTPVLPEHPGQDLAVQALPVERALPLGLEERLQLRELPEGEEPPLSVLRRPGFYSDDYHCPVQAGSG